MKKKTAGINKIKKTRLPLKKMSETEKDYVAVILEEVRSNFKAFGESLEFVRQRGDATFEEVGKIKVEIEEIKDTQVLMQEDIKIIKQDVAVLKQDVAVLKQDVSVLKQDVAVLKNDVKRIDGRLDNIEQEVVTIRNDINFLKSILTQKADIDFLKVLETRLIRVERHLKLAQ